MSAHADASLLTCPRCPDGELVVEGGFLRCTRCDRRYPVIGTIPCLMEDPVLWRALWLSRLTDFLTATEGTLRQWRTEADLPDLLPRTRARIARLGAALGEQRARVQALFGELIDGATQIIPTRPEPRQELAVLACNENIFRDWAWGDHEIEATRALAAGLFAEPPGRLAVLGAGAGRLAVEIHRSLHPTETVALDENPLPLMVAARIVRGETVTLPEFPVAPHSDDGVALMRDLRASIAPADARGLTFVFADALRPPFAPGSLDTVLTAWFIDVVRTDLGQLAAVINRMLRPGGQWINVGPLRFAQSVSRSYAVEEVWEIVEQHAFAVGARAREDLPYFDSPVSGSRRTETVFGFAARKTGEARPAPARDALPPWITDVRAPVPPTPGLMVLGRTSMFTAGAISLIDGVRSLSDIADQASGSLGVDRAVVLDQLRAFFAKLPPG